MGRGRCFRGERGGSVRGEGRMVRDTVGGGFRCFMQFGKVSSIGDGGGIEHPNLHLGAMFQPSKKNAQGMLRNQRNLGQGKFKFINIILNLTMLLHLNQAGKRIFICLTKSGNHISRVLGPWGVDIKTGTHVVEMPLQSNPIQMDRCKPNSGVSRGPIQEEELFTLVHPLSNLAAVETREFNLRDAGGVVVVRCVAVVVFAIVAGTRGPIVVGGMGIIRVLQGLGLKETSEFFQAAGEQLKAIINLLLEVGKGRLRTGIVGHEDRRTDTN